MKFVIIDENGKFSVVTDVHGPGIHDDRYYRKDQTYWMPPVKTFNDLPLTGNKHGDCRVVLEEGNIYAWIEEEGVDESGNAIFVGDWLPVLGKYWNKPVEEYADLPLTGNLDGEIRLVKKQNTLYKWNADLAEWEIIKQESFWKQPVATKNDLPLTGNNDGDARLVLDTNTIYRWSSNEAEWKAVSSTSLYWNAPVDSYSDLPATGNVDGEIRLVKSTNDVYRWDANKSEWVDIHEGLSGSAPLGHPDLQGDIPISPSHEGFLSDGNNFIKYSAGNEHSHIINQLPFNSGDMEFGPGDKGFLKLYKNGVLIDTLDLEAHFNESERNGNQSSTPWYSQNGYIVVTFCGIYENFPQNQWAICHIVFTSSWIDAGDNPEIQLIHES